MTVDFDESMAPKGMAGLMLYRHCPKWKGRLVHSLDVFDGDRVWGTIQGDEES
jgi:hypothetical protein